MLPDPEDIIVTTGGQQAIDLITKTLIDPGDSVICEAPDLPGRGAGLLQLRGRRHPGRDATTRGCGSTCSRRCSSSLAAEGRRPKFIYSVPTFQNPAGVTLSLERRRRLVEIARERELLVVEDNPYGLLRYEGEPLPPLYQLDGGDYVIYLGTFSKILSPGIRLGWAVAPPPVMEKVVLGKQASDLCTSTLTQYFVARVLRRGALARLHRQPDRDLPRRAATRCSRRSSRHFPPAGDLDASPRAACSSGRRCPTTSTPTDLLAKALRENVAFVPGAGGLRRRAAGASSMRLNFSGVERGRDPRGDPPDRRGRSTSRSSSTRRSPASIRCRGRRRERARRPRRADVLPLRRARRGDEGRGAEGRALAGARGLAALRGPGRGRAGALGHDVVALDVGADLVAAAAAERPDVAFIALHGPGGEDGTVQELLEILGIPYTGPGRRRLRALHGQGPRQARAARGGDPDAGLGSPSTRPPSASSARPTRWSEIEARLGFPLVVKPARGGRRSASSSSPRRESARRRWSPPSATTTGSCSSATSTGRELAVSVLGGEALPIVEAIPRESDRYDFEARYEIGRTEFVCPAELEPERAAAVHEAALRAYECSAARASPAST